MFVFFAGCVVQICSSRLNMYKYFVNFTVEGQGFYLFILKVSNLRHIIIVCQPVLHDWCNKGRGMCYPVWDGAYKRTLAANRKE